MNVPARLGKNKVIHIQKQNTLYSLFIFRTISLIYAQKTAEFAIYCQREGRETLFKPIH